MWLLNVHMKAFKQQHTGKDTEFDTDCVVRVERALKAWKKWWDLLWNHPIYHLATVLNPFYRTTFLNSLSPVLRMSQKDQKAKITWLKQQWLDFKAGVDPLSYDTQSALRAQSEYPQRRSARRTTTHVLQESEDQSIEAATVSGWQF